MKTRIKSILLIGIFALTSAILVLSNNNIKVEAESLFNPINVVILGDSIADGDGLETYPNKDSNGFISNCYSKLFVNDLKVKYGQDNVIAKSYAISGENTTTFLNKFNLENFENSTEKNYYASMITSISNADIILINIGANDVLGPTINNFGNLISSLIQKDAYKNGGFDFLIDDLNNGLAKFNSNFPQIVNLINQLSPNSYKLYNNIYNPYISFINEDVDKDGLMDNEDNDVTDIGIPIDISMSGFFMKQYIYYQNLNQMGKMAEEYINILNQSLKSHLLDANKCFLVDIKTEFDNYLNGEYDYTQLGQEKKHSDILNVNLIDVNNIQLTEIYFDSIKAYLDPHPNANGHDLIFNELLKFYNNKFINVKLNYNGGNVNAKSGNFVLTEKGKAFDISRIILPVKDGYMLKGWNRGSNNYNFSTIIYSDIELIANWVKSYKVTFNSNGGSAVTFQEVEENGTINKPNAPTKTGAGINELFAGWYYLSGEELIYWDFENDKVTSDVILYAKWTGLTCANTDKLKQTVNNVSNVEFKVETSDGDVQWYVNEQLQSNSGNNFIFMTPEKVEEYTIYCVVAGIKSRKYSVEVDYYIPKEIKVFIQKANDKNTYTFAIENGQYINGSKCVWYMSTDEYSDEFEEVFAGDTIFTKNIDKGCKVYAVYKCDNGEELKSNYETIIPSFIPSNILFIIIGVAGSLVALVVVFTIISRRRYKSYY